MSQPQWAPPPAIALAISKLPGIWGTYGQPGSGKTIDECRTFPNGVWAGDTADFRSVVKEIQYAPPADLCWFGHHTLGTLHMKLDEFFGPNTDKNPKKIVSVVIDELNTILERTVAASTLKHGMQKYGAMKESLNRLLDRARLLNKMGVHFAWNAHSKRPEFEELTSGTGTDATRVRGALENEGGPDGSAAAMRLLAKRSDALFRVDIDPALVNNKHPFAYYADHTIGGPSAGANYHQKDRLGLVSKGPVNLGEILRYAGFSIPRPPGIEEYLEPRVQWAAGLDEHTALNEFLKAAQAPGVPDYVVIWGLTDLRARMSLQKSASLQATLRDRFGIMG